MKKKPALTFVIVLILMMSVTLSRTLSIRKRNPGTIRKPDHYSGRQAYQFAKELSQWGPRTPGSAAHANSIQYIQTQLKNFNWETERQDFNRYGMNWSNILAHHSGNTSCRILLGAHYDSRLYADRDPDHTKRTEPVHGANDGASAVAVLLEIARTLPETFSCSVTLAFFDGEDQGNIQNYPWIIGSTYYTESLDQYPNQVIILDMVGDQEQTFYFESNSDHRISELIWQTAHDLKYQDYFIPETRYSVLDDHTPFVEKGIPAIDIIDFDYPHWHTTHDTIDKISADSLQRIGNVIIQYLKSLE